MDQFAVKSTNSLKSVKSRTSSPQSFFSFAGPGLAYLA